MHIFYNLSWRCDSFLWEWKHELKVIIWAHYDNFGLSCDLSKDFFKYMIINLFGRKRCRHRFDMRQGDKRPLPAGKLVFSLIFSPSHIKLTNIDPNKDSQSVERP